MLKTISSLSDYLGRDSNSLARSAFTCPHCGKIHTISIGEMRCAQGLVAEVPASLHRVLGRAPRKAQVIYDLAIEEIIDEGVIQPLKTAGIPLAHLPAGQKGLLLDSETPLGNHLAASVDTDADILIGAGSGVICDLTKWVATQVKRPYMLLGTAPSMNAYSSITATMTEHDVKTSILLDPADSVLLDVDILAQSPMPMIHAGVGDLAARAICNADWKLSSVINGGYFCPLPYEMTRENERLYLSAADGIARRDPLAIELLGEAVLKSGLSMTILDGETSPSSGAEHVISHFWDLLTHTRGLPKNLHGLQVGVGTVIMLAFYEIMRRVDIGKIDPQTVVRRRRPLEELQRDNSLRYGQAASMFNTVVVSKFRSDTHLADHIRRVQRDWEIIWSQIDPYVPRLDSIREPLRRAGVPLTLAAVQRSKEDAIETLEKGPQYRSRYTMLDLAWELGLMPELAEEALEHAGVVN